MENPTTINLETTQLSNNIVKADVYIKNAPTHFLGLAFELNIEGQKWDFQKYELGSVLKKPSELLVLATRRAEPKPRIVFGLSYKGKTLVNKEKTTPDDGKLVSFYLQISATNPLKFTFSQNIISIHEKGRKNLKDQGVIWTNKEVYLKPFKQQSLDKKETVVAQKISQISQSKKKPDEKFTSQPELDKETVTSDQIYLPIEKSEESPSAVETLSVNTFQPDQNLTQMYFMLGGIFIFMVIIAVVTAFILILRKNKM